MVGEDDVPEHSPKATDYSNIAMENGPFEDVFPIKHGDIPASYVSLPEGINCFVKVTVVPWQPWHIP